MSQRNKDSTKAAILHGARSMTPSQPESAERAMTEPRAPDALAGIKFAIILNGEIIQSPRQLTIPLYDSWSQRAWDRMHNFNTSPKPIRPLDWLFQRVLPNWIDAMYGLNDPDTFD